MLAVHFLSLALAISQSPADVQAKPEPVWLTDYAAASKLAQDQKKDLLIHFRADQHLDAALADPALRERLAKFVLLRVPADYEFQGKVLLTHPALVEMMGKPGLAIVSLHNKDLPTFNTAVSTHPLVGSRYYWAPGYGVNEIATILDLPPDATLSQRSMIYAVSVHPERPRSVLGRAHPGILSHTQRHSLRQAAMNNQHHANIIAAGQQITAETGEPIYSQSEVVAESWGNFVGGENVLEAAFSCVDAWRHSPGHWSAVAGAHRYYGYDIAKGANGTWYATGFFSN
ncbi:MAG TPA: hypothetical protein VGZ47_21090 [Gemmataceae bacterium]|nr:hypothetical protein [Gemmataceae bacterium]